MTYEHKEYSASIFYGKSIADMIGKPFPSDIKAGGRKTGRMRRWMRRSLLARRQRQQAVGYREIMTMTPSINFKPRISLHQKRKQSRGFVSNRKPGAEDDRVEWNPPHDTGDK